MKSKLMLIGTAALLLAAACNKADFGTSGRSKKRGVVGPGGVGPASTPLDVSELNENKNTRDKGGPLAGKGEVLSKTVDLGCDESQGVIIDVVNPNGGKDQDDYGAGQDPGGKGQKLLALGEPLVIGKDGNPVDDGSYGKGGKGKGEEPQLPEKPAIEVAEESKVTTKVKGKFCPTAKNKLTVLFVVDYSGSMGKHVPSPKAGILNGNDPQINGSCGRLRAAEAIVNKLQSKLGPEDKVTIGMVPFAGGIVTEKIIDLMDLNDFAALITKDNFCQYVVQSPLFGLDPTNPGAILSPGNDASTNYRAAFTAATSLLSGVYGNKEVFFISDGEPTSGGADPIQAGIEAGSQLRARVDNLTLNALFLGDSGRAAARQVLVAVAGSEQRVREADNADQLADAIVSFPEAMIDESSGRALLTIPPYKPEADLGLVYLKQEGPGVWTYETRPFVLLGIKGKTVEHTVTVTAQGKDGSTHKATVIVRYRQ